MMRKTRRKRQNILRNVCRVRYSTINENIVELVTVVFQKLENQFLSSSFFTHCSNHTKYILRCSGWPFLINLNEGKLLKLWIQLCLITVYRYMLFVLPPMLIVTHLHKYKYIVIYHFIIFDMILLKCWYFVCGL